MSKDRLAGLAIDWGRVPRLVAWAQQMEMPSGRAVVDDHAFHAKGPGFGRIPMDTIPALLRETGLDQPAAVEHQMAVYVDHHGDLLATHHLAKGRRHQCQMDPLVLLRGLAACNASGVFLVHNHPSPSPVPSPDDIALTRSVAYLCFCASTPLVDHVIVGSTGRHWSFGCGWSPVQSATTASQGGLIWVLDPRDTTPEAHTEDRRRLLVNQWHQQTRESGDAT